MGKSSSVSKNCFVAINILPHFGRIFLFFRPTHVIECRGIKYSGGQTIIAVNNDSPSVALDGIAEDALFLQLGRCAAGAADIGHRHRFAADGYVVERGTVKHCLVDIRLHTVAYRKNDRHADQSDACGKARYDGSALFGQQILS